MKDINTEPTYGVKFKFLPWIYKKIATLISTLQHILQQHYDSIIHLVIEVKCFNEEFTPRKKLQFNNDYTITL